MKTRGYNLKQHPSGLQPTGELTGFQPVGGSIRPHRCLTQSMENPYVSFVLDAPEIALRDLIEPWVTFPDE